MLTNKNFLAGILNVINYGEDFEYDENDVYISYLPLAHIFDRLGVYSIFSAGA